MRRAWWSLFIVVLCLPLGFTAWLVAAAHFPELDASTARAPSFLRDSVIEVIFQRAGHGKGPTDRILRLDPNNIEALDRWCAVSAGTEKLTACGRSQSTAPSMWGYEHVGEAETSLGDHCAAERSFNSANGLYNETIHSSAPGAADDGSERDDATQAVFVRNMGVAALRCGHLPDSRASLEVAQMLDLKLAVPDPNDPDGQAKFAADLQLDREYLSIVYDRGQEAALSTAACSKAHPTWKSCHCSLTSDSVACTGGPPEAPAEPADRH